MIPKTAVKMVTQSLCVPGVWPDCLVDFKLTLDYSFIGSCYLRISQVEISAVTGFFSNYFVALS